MLYPLPQSLQPSVRSLFFHLASLTPFVCLQNSQLLNAWQLNRGEQPLVQTLQASTLLPMHLCFLLKSPPRQSRVENCRQTTWLTFWIITSALTFQNKSVYVWVKSNINEECEHCSLSDLPARRVFTLICLFDGMPSLPSLDKRSKFECL